MDLWKVSFLHQPVSRFHVGLPGLTYSPIFLFHWGNDVEPHILSEEHESAVSGKSAVCREKASFQWAYATPVTQKAR